MNFRIMAKTHFENVCRCLSNGRVSFFAHDVMQQVYEEGCSAVEKSASLSEKASKALLLGDLCEGAGFPHLALQIWRGTLAEIEWADEERVGALMYRADFVFRNNVTIDPALRLARRIDLLLRRLGVRLAKSTRLGTLKNYRMLWYDVYYEYLP